VLVTYNFRYLASAPKVRWRAEPKLLPQLCAALNLSTSGCWEAFCGTGTLPVPVSEKLYSRNPDAHSLQVTVEGVLSRIHYFRVHTATEQRALLHSLDGFLRKHNGVRSDALNALLLGASSGYVVQVKCRTHVPRSSPA
jgi:hypothetical protein